MASPDLNVRELRVLDALLREQSLTRTAQVLGTTQPGVSKTLRRLREQFADPLFVRNGQGMTPTAKALDIAADLRSLLDAADGLRSAAVGFDPSISNQQFRLLLTDVGSVLFLPPLLARLAEAAPAVRLRAVPLDARRFDVKLEAGEADVALGAFATAAPHLRRQRLYVDEYRSLVRKGHPRSGQVRSTAGFLAECHVLVSASDTGHAAHSSAERVLAGKIPNRNIILRLPSFVSGAIVAARTDAVITVPSTLAAVLTKSLGLISFRTPLELPRIEIAQYWHERFHRDAGHRWLRQTIAQVFRTRPASV